MVDGVVLLRLSRWMHVVVLLLIVRLERLRNIVIVPSDSTSCCARIIRPLLPGVDILTWILAESECLPIKGIGLRGI